MRLKIFFFPLALVVSLVMAVLYIQPEVTQALANFKEKQKLNQLENDAKTRANNVQLLVQDLKNKASLEESVLNQYLPQKQQSDTLVDAVNFLANKTGVVVEDFTPAETINPVVEAPPVVVTGAGASSQLDPSFASENAQPEEVVPPVQMNSVSVNIKGRGAYPNIKDFLTKLAFTNHFNSIDEISIGAESNTSTTTPTESGQLTFDVTVTFSSLPLVGNYKNASADPAKDVFTATSLDTKSVQALNEFLARGAAVVPQMQPVTGGKVNPFVR